MFLFLVLLSLITCGYGLDYKLSVLIFSEPHETFEELKGSVTVSVMTQFFSGLRGRESKITERIFISENYET